MADLKYLLDSNICIYLLEGRSDALLQRVSSTISGAIGISSIVYAEVLLGMHVTDQAELGERFFSKFPILPFDEAAAAHYAQMPFRRGSFDNLIAAHTAALECILVTNNEKDFAKLRGLHTENWTIE